jgi:3-hexulose-6-phosphate synthase
MKLQIAFDSLDLAKAIAIAEQIQDFADIIEIGSLLIFKYGAHAVKEFRLKLPEKVILADTKIVDRGREAAKIMFDAGADWVSVMAGTSKKVIHAVATIAHDHHKHVILDLVDAASSGQSALEAKTLGMDALMFHQTSEDENPFAFFEPWEMVRGNSGLPIYVSAHISRETAQSIIDLKPDALIIGKAIVHADDPVKEAQFFYELCKTPA